MENVPAKTQGTELAHAPTPADLLQIAVSNNADMDKLEKLMELQIRWEEREARKAYTEAMSAFKASPPKVIKDSKVEFKQTKYSHATLAGATEAISSELSKHGLSAAWSTGQGDSGVSVTCTITHVLGHSESVTLTAPPDNSGSKNNIQAIGSTVTYLQRYTLFAITGLAAADQDDDGHGTEVEYISKDQQSKITDLLLAIYGDDHTAFLGHIKCESVDKIPAKDFTKHLNGLKAIYKKRPKK